MRNTDIYLLIVVTFENKLLKISIKRMNYIPNVILRTLNIFQLI